MTTDIGYEIIGAAMEVHRILGPGLLESAYKSALTKELTTRGFSVKTEVPIDLIYKGDRLDVGYRADMIVNDEVIIELKTVTEINPIFHMQLITYLKVSGKKLGFLINFNSPSLKYNESYFRKVNNLNNGN
ncbi:MAG: GxxExxY protein [Muribaculaceae bacterium]|nr:GxxExxY protein [Muribaculaceae bacterium]